MNLRTFKLPLIVLLTLSATPALAQDRPIADDSEAARKELDGAWCLRVPHLCTRGNPYAVSDSNNPFNRLDVQVLSWSKMRQRVEGAPISAPDPVRSVTVTFASGRSERVE
jgi:hypothetical protein